MSRPKHETNGQPPPTDEDAIDLSDLEAKGVEGVVADLGGADAAGEGGAGSGRPRRPAWVSLVVVALAIPLLVSMYPDFRYWLRDGEPEALGQAADLVRDGRVPAGLHNRYVSLQGTPDVRNVALGKGPEHVVRYFRLMESDGRLVAVVRTAHAEEERRASSPYPTTFEGRVVRLGDLGRSSWSPMSEASQFKWLQQFYEIEDVTRTVDSTVAALAHALRERSGDDLQVETEEGIVRLRPQDRVRLVVERPEARLLLGVESFTEGKADALVDALGFPSLDLDGSARPDDVDPTRPHAIRSGPGQHRYVVRIPAAEQERVVAELRSQITGEVNDADPRQGVTLLPMLATYMVPAADLQLEGDAVVFELGDNTTSPGYELVDGELREIDLQGAPMRVPLAELSAVRLEKPIRLDPDGYAIVHGQTPADQRLVGLLWLFTLAVALANLAALGLSLRRRSS